MNPASAMDNVERSLAVLKDFQRATVDVVYDQLFCNGQQKMLVADEVGLGKTIVAKGVIARRIQEKLNSGDGTPLKVTYICSNQVIAHENVGKLDIYPNQESHDHFASRLTYLAFVPTREDSGMLRLNTLTPATSFNKGSSTGQQNERRILFSLLMHHSQIAEHGEAVATMLRCGVQTPLKSWYNELLQQRDQPCGNKLRPDCHERFLKAIQEKSIRDVDGPLLGHLEISHAISLDAAVIEFCKVLELDDVEKFRKASDHLVRELKDALADVCVEYINADLYILDEFQRFKELVDQDSNSQTARIARRIFNKPDARILLLSATPFKAYTGNTPWESGEEHYEEFRTILKFLFNDESDDLARYETHRQGLFKQLLELGSTPNEIDTTHRDALQNILRKVMCRTERLSVSEDFNAMTKDKWDEPLPISLGDIQNFVATDNIVRFLNQTESNLRHQLHAPVEFCKSAPFPLSFLDDYKLKKRLGQRRAEHDLQRELQKNKAAWIDRKSINRYQLDLTANGVSDSNAKLQHVLHEVMGTEGEKLLWIPPSLPCYPLAGVFQESVGFSKTLIFSAWLMVPRMLSTLISYELERRTIGNQDSVDTQEQQQRKYFHRKTEKRHPIPQLVFSQRKAETGETSNNMSNFALLYPSQTLADLFDPQEALVSRRSLAEIRSDVAEKVKRRIEEAELHQFGTSAGESDRWYWAAPLLLDRNNSDLRAKLTDWFLELPTLKDCDFLTNPRNTDGQKGEQSSRDKHFEEFAHCFHNPYEAGLGSIPEDLPMVLADQAMASPAITTLRSVTATFEDADFSERTLFALDTANEFLAIFNKPEAIAAVRLSTSKGTYWRRVLEYCLNGCVQSVLDEFIHVLQADCPELWMLFRRLIDSMSLTTASIKVDDLNSFLNGKSQLMRCHYAVDLGNQRLETEGGQNRIKGIRHLFNSPFRPFVLATTSIGQEGLDFHTYCRKIVHWNLPNNPIDLEQREGRINRFKGLVIRQQLANRYGQQLTRESVHEKGVWNALFDLADQHERERHGKCELIPYWHVESDQFQIERLIPFYPFSKDRAKLSTLLKTLALYRLAFGQPRQTELVEHLLTNVSESKIQEIRENLMIDLSPINYLNGGQQPRIRRHEPEN